MTKLECLIKYGIIDRGDGTIIDNITNLMWMSSTTEESFDWWQANEYCKKLNLAGYSDWRLPTSNELIQLIKKRPIEKMVTDNLRYEPWYYWSSTGSSDTDMALAVDFDSCVDCVEEVCYKKCDYSIIAVRNNV